MKFEYKGQANSAGVYKITNTTNGKIYVGSAKRFKERGKGHLRSLEKGNHHNVHLQRAFNQDGTDAFVFEVLEVVDGDKLARTTKEQEYIDQYRDNWELCYNFCKETVAKERTVWSKDPEETRRKLSEASKKMWETRDGSKHSALMKRLWQSEEHRQKVLAKEHSAESRKRQAEKMRAIGATEEHKAKLSKAGLAAWKDNTERREKAAKFMAGRKLSPEHVERLRQINTGKRHSEETKQKISENSHVRERIGAKHPRAQAVCQYDLEGNFIKEWDCITTAASALGLKSSSNISSCAKGKKPSVGGYLWKYGKAS